MTLCERSFHHLIIHRANSSIVFVDLRALHNALLAVKKDGEKKSPSRSVRNKLLSDRN